MIQPLASHLQYSIISVRRFLSAIGYYSSFTHNGAWYTLRSIPRFGRNGLWFHGDIGFSRAGSLTRTLIDQINRSPSGMTAEQLGETVGGRYHSVLVNLSRKGKICRQKLGRAFVYLSTDPQTQTQQKQIIDMQSLPGQPLPAEIAVFVLVELIRHPNADGNQLSQSIMQKHGVSVETSQIEAFLDFHGLKKKIQTPASKFFMP
jgi:hypothetical protein